MCYKNAYTTWFLLEIHSFLRNYKIKKPRKLTKKYVSFIWQNLIPPPQSEPGSEQLYCPSENIIKRKSYMTKKKKKKRTLMDWRPLQDKEMSIPD